MKTEQLIQNLALKYERFKCMLPQVPASELATFRQDIEKAYDKLPACLTVEFVDVDPYPDLETMSEDITVWDRLKVSALHNESDLLPGLLNLKFRAVHDYFHFLLSQPFTFKGELNCYKAQKFQITTDMGKRLLYSEIVYQTAYCTYFGKFPTKQKVII